MKVVATNQHGQAVSSCRVLVNEDLTDQDTTVVETLELDANKSDNTDNDVFDDNDYLHISEDLSPVGSSYEQESQQQKQRKRTVVNVNKPKKRVHVNNESLLNAKPKFLKLFESSKVSF